MIFTLAGLQIDAVRFFIFIKRVQYGIFSKKNREKGILYDFKLTVLFHNPKKHYICSRIQNAEPNKKLYNNIK